MILVVVSLLFLACFSGGIEGHILRLSCTEYANFSMITKDYALQEPLIRTLNNTEVAKCQSKCVNQFGCKSINTEEGGSKRCELLAASAEDVKDGLPQLSARPGWTYRTTDYKTLLVRT